MTNYALNNLIDIFRQIQVNHEQLNDFYFGDVANLPGNKQYPLLLVDIDSTQFSENLTKFRFNCFVLDKLQANFENENEVYSDTLRVQEDIYTYLDRSEEYIFEVNPIADVERVLSDINSDMVAGWNLKVEVNVPFGGDLCNIPGLVSSIPSFETSTSSSPMFLTCENIGSCSTFNNLLNTKANLSGATFTGNIFAPVISGGTIFSGGTDLSTIIASITGGDGNDITRIQPGRNIYTGGTANNPTVNISAATLSYLSATTISATTFYSGSTPLSQILTGGTSGDLWSASTGTNSIIANNGTGNISSGQYTLVAGFNNSASGNYSVIAGGQINIASGNKSAIGGGTENLSSAYYTTVAGGKKNKARANNSAILGGLGNTIQPSAVNSVIAGGISNTANFGLGFIGGGYYNSTYGTYATIGGGLNNRAAYGSSVLGGQNNYASQYSSIGGGNSNTASGYFSVIAGGFQNTSSGNRSSILGGYNNRALEYYSSVVGGVFNTASGMTSFVAQGNQNNAAGHYSSVINGKLNFALGDYSSVVGGQSNLASGFASTILAGQNNTVNGTASSIIAGTGQT